MTTLSLTLHPDPAAMADAVAAEIAGALGAALRSGAACFAATGGTTAGAIYDRLAGAPLAWDQVDVTLTDERCVPEDHPHSNLRLLRERLFVGPAASARFAPLTEEAVAALPPFDVTLLGMGADLHVASLFPAGEGVEAAMASAGHVARVTPDPLPANAPHARLTLTPAALARSRRIVLAFTGADKRAAWESACAGAPSRVMEVLARAPHATVTAHWAP